MTLQTYEAFLAHLRPRVHVFELKGGRWNTEATMTGGPQGERLVESTGECGKEVKIK